jgi:endogenous inhibitor of DNA gyrase (YacG/DUF329 family)
MQCPICKKKVAFGSKQMPFCSQRCRDIDLGNWADEKYVISSPARQNELSGELESASEAFDESDLDAGRRQQ